MFEILEIGYPISEAAFDGGFPAQVRVDWKYPKYEPLDISVIRDEIPFLAPYLRWTPRSECFLFKEILTHDELLELIRIFELKTLRESGKIKSITRRARMPRRSS